MDRLAKATAKKSLSDTNRRPPGIAAFQSAIKEWAKQQTVLITDHASARLGHTYQSPNHIKHIKKLKKDAISAITQLRSGHAPLNQYL